MLSVSYNSITTGIIIYHHHYQQPIVRPTNGHGSPFNKSFQIIVGNAVRLPKFT